MDSLLGGSALNYIGHRACVRRASAGASREMKLVELGDMDRKKELAGGQDRKRFHRATRNGAWLSAIPHHINSTELSQEEDGIIFASDMG